MTMIERVARVLAQGEGYGPDALIFHDTPSWHLFVTNARAAIEAMREPTDDMIEAGWPHTADPCWPENVGAAYKAMIDVALSD